MGSIAATENKQLVVPGKDLIWYVIERLRESKELLNFRFLKINAANDVSSMTDGISNRLATAVKL